MPTPTAERPPTSEASHTTSRASSRTDLHIGVLPRYLRGEPLTQRLVPHAAHFFFCPAPGARSFAPPGSVCVWPGARFFASPGVVCCCPGVVCVWPGAVPDFPLVCAAAGRLTSAAATARATI